MEAIISSILTGAIVMGLVGIIFKGMSDRMKKVEDEKANKETCKVIHDEANAKFKAIFDKLDAQSETLADISGDVKAIRSNGNG